MICALSRFQTLSSQCDLLLQLLDLLLDLCPFRKLCLQFLTYFLKLLLTLFQQLFLSHLIAADLAQLLIKF